ncbi:MAG: beta-lactamase family protein [Gammaproteobacteria bacterium]|nr:beta-lactamase family protein [Gammaproteobacteria bacterium]
MRKHLIFGLLAASLLQLGSVKADEPAAPPATLEALKTELLQTMDKEGIPGAGIALFKNHELLWVGGIGMADKEQRIPAGADTPFGLASISKSFTAMAVMKLVEAGKVELDAPIRRYLPDAPIVNPWEAQHPVTVAQVLEHTAGFDDMHLKAFVTDKPNASMDQGIADNLASYQVRWQPGQRFAYSNPGYILLGKLIETMSGEDFDRYMEREILKPLGMDQATFRYLPERGLAQGYGDDGQPEPYLFSSDRPTGALQASPRELAGFVRAMMRRESPILSRDAILRIETPTTSAGAQAGLSAGFGLANHNREIQGFSLRRHTGGIPGFASYYAYEPNLGFGFVLLINKMLPPKAMTTSIVGFLARDLTPPAKPSATLSAEELARYTGFYRNASPRNSLFQFLDRLLAVTQIKLEGGVLVMNDLVGESKRLVPVGGKRFRIEDELTPSVAFIAQPDGSHVLMVHGGDYLEPTSAVSAWAPIVLSGAAVLAYALAMLYALIWLFSWARGRSPVGTLALRTLPLFAGLSLLAHGLLLGTVHITQLGVLSAGSLALFLSNIGIPVFSALALAVLAFHWRQPLGRFLRWHSLAASLGGVWLSGWLAYWGYLGVRFWTW